MKKYNILVFPCGSEIGLEIYRSLAYSKNIELFGGSSVDDHGKFIYSNYIGNLANIHSVNLIDQLKIIVKKHNIDAIYPTMDKVICILKKNEKFIGCKIISSPLKTTLLCLSKLKTYKKLSNVIKTPEYYTDLKSVKNFPVFVKPIEGYGSRGSQIINDYNELKSFYLSHDFNSYLTCEYLPGNEFTIDCFSDKNGKLLFVGARIRNRIKAGISVNTSIYSANNDLFKKIAEKINQTVKFNGAWFFQMKEDNNGKLTLLEIAARLGGSSSLFRAKGANFALLSVYSAFGKDVEIVINNYDVSLDRAFNCKFKLNHTYKHVYVDFDDCLVINEKLNNQLVSFLCQCINNKIKTYLIIKHEGNLKNNYHFIKIHNLFNQIIHINKNENKYKKIKHTDSIFIDDSFHERREVAEKLNIPVFSPDMVEVILN